VPLLFIQFCFWNAFWFYRYLPRYEKKNRSETRVDFHMKCPLVVSDFNTNYVSQKISVDLPNIAFHENPWRSWVIKSGKPERKQYALPPTVFWVAKSCTSERTQRFGVEYLLQLHSPRTSQEWIRSWTQLPFSSCCLMVWLNFRPWKLSPWILPKRRALTELQGPSTQKTVLFTVTGKSHSPMENCRNLLILKHCVAQ
jgi:hypothetical protein